MNPEKQQRLNACIQEIAEILYEETPKGELTDLENIEKTVRRQILEHVSPNQTLFLLKKLPKQRAARPEL